MSKVVNSAGIFAVGSAGAIAAGIAGFLFIQARRPARQGSYVALGSSFAAGLGLGARDPGSPIQSMRSINGYPQRLARMIGLSIVDMSSSGATASQVLRGGQLFLPPQVDAIGRETQLVTLTAGGNDVGYVGDLMLSASKRRRGPAGWLTRRLARRPKPADQRNFEQLQATLVSLLAEIRTRAPRAQIIVATYPSIIPLDGACVELGISESDAVVLRGVADKLADITRRVAREGGATIVDMASISVGHEVGSQIPWVNGSAPKSGAAFHPTQAGAEATAAEIAKVARS